ncbi:transcription termination factor Rho [Salinifilum ghardaiensis]
MSDTELLSSEAANSSAAADQQGSGQSSTANGSANGTTRRRGGLSGMVLPELRELARELGIETKGLRKGDLIAAIRERQAASSNESAGSASGNGKQRSRGNGKTREAKGDGAASGSEVDSSGSEAGGSAPNSSKAHQPALDEQESASGQRGSTGEQTSNNGGQQGGRNRPRRQDFDSDDNRRGGRRRRPSGGRGGNGAGSHQQEEDRASDKSDQKQRSEQHDSDDDGNRNRRGRRYRDRRRNRGRGEGGSEPEVREDDVLLPVAGILDVLDNYAFVRTSGYLAGPNDVYVSLSLVRKYGLRRGDAIQGVIRQPREGEQQRQKFNPLVRVDAINGLDTDSAKKRAEFHKLTPLYPNERLRLEDDPQHLTGRIIDLVMPIGKGQRALIVSPPKAGKTMVLQSIANAITANNPECHLMVVLADERPEEVTDMQRSVNGEVIASTFDRPPSDHTTVAELSIERAKRLVEMGHDVVVLLDSITRLGRAYNLAAPASGRILSGGVDSTALYPPKRFLGAARNIEGGGSLTIVATALVETGSTMDTVIFEEFKGTGNAELKLDRKLADKRLFPAVDVDASSTRKDEILMSQDELAVTHKLRRVLAALDTQQALELVLDKLRKTSTNIEFLMQVAKNTPGKDED